MVKKFDSDRFLTFVGKVAERSGEAENLVRMYGVSVSKFHRANIIEKPFAKIKVEYERANLGLYGSLLGNTEVTQVRTILKAIDEAEIASTTEVALFFRKKIH